jgi:dipeptidyl aminopeptidase/acylaminoacyl peptidase
MMAFVSMHAQLLDTIKIQSGDHTIYGINYAGDDSQPRPSLLLLHGFPGGYHDVLDLGEKLSQDSINVFTLTLSGIAISEGTYADSSPIVDLRHAIDFFFKPENIEKYNIDPDNFMIGGWSFGGGLSLYMGAHDDRISRIISIAGFNGDAFLTKCAESEEFEKFMMAVFATYRFRGMVNFNPKELIGDLERHREKFTPIDFSNKIAAKPLLLFGCTDDAEVNLTDHILPYYYAIKSKGGEVKFHVYQCGHRFGGHLDQLADDISRWIKK